jgi:hypothetical protein
MLTYPPLGSMTDSWWDSDDCYPPDLEDVALWWHELGDQDRSDFLGRQGWAREEPNLFYCSADGADRKGHSHMRWDNRVYIWNDVPESEAPPCRT